MRFLTGVFFTFLLSAAASPPVIAAPAGGPAAIAPGLRPPFGLGPLADYTTFTRTMERESGLIDLLKKDDQLYFDLSANQLGQTFLIEPVLASGIGSGAFAGKMYEAFMVRFERRGKTINWVVPNVDFSAAAGTTQNAITDSTGDSVIAVSPIVAEDPQTKRIVIEPSILLTDFEEVGAELGRRITQPVPGPIPGLMFRAPAAVGLDPSRTFVEKTKALPANDEISVVLGFTAPPNAIATVPDARGFSMKMHYSIIALGESRSYVPRLADDRIGYQVTTHARLGNPTAATPFVRFINRWDMRKAPVVFYLSNSIPAQYREPIRSALLSWNAVFAKAGISHAVQVRDQPSDPAWDPDDARYSVVRWISSIKPEFAGYTGVVTNPQSGEVLRAGIVIDGEDVREVQSDYRDFGLDLRAHGSAACAGTECGYAAEYADQAAFARIALTAYGVHVNREEFARSWIRSVVLHESGHAFGLRHNFAASTLYSPQQLRSRTFTAAHGLAASVMDYVPVNIARVAREQGPYFQEAFGPYDYWAIKYGYARFAGIRHPSDEAAFLRAIARESAQPGHAFGGDEEAFGAGWVDPRISAFDLSSDPLEYDREQFQLAQRLLQKVNAQFTKGDTSFFQERLAFSTIMRSEVRAASLAVRFIGGTYTSRAHAGQGAAAPFRPIPRAMARRAFDLLNAEVFSERAFTYPAGLIGHLGTEGFYDIDTPNARPDFPLTQFTGTVQDYVLQHVFDPAGLARIQDNEIENGNAAGTLRLSDVFEWARNGIWNDVNRGGAIAPLRRETQRHFVDQMAVYAQAPSGALAAAGAPRESQALARYELVRIDADISRALRRPPADVATRAHLEEEHARIARTLHAINVQAI